MLIELWLDQPVWLILGSLAALLAGTGLLVFFLAQGRWTRGFAASLTGVVAPFFGCVAILFALLTGFLASDAWERGRQASRSILTERDAVVAVQDLSLAAAADLAELRTALRSYLEAVVHDEWPLLKEGKSSAKAAAALREILREVSDPQLTGDLGQVAHAALLEQALRARSARSDRLALSEQYSDHSKWWTVLLLAWLTQVSLALVHLERPQAQGAALTVFTAAAVIALGLVAIRERPFDGPLAIEPIALREALSTMGRSSSEGAEGSPASISR